MDEFRGKDTIGGPIKDKNDGRSNEKKAIDTICLHFADDYICQVQWMVVDESKERSIYRLLEPIRFYTVAALRIEDLRFTTLSNQKHVIFNHSENMCYPVLQLASQLESGVTMLQKTEAIVNATAADLKSNPKKTSGVVNNFFGNKENATKICQYLNQAEKARLKYIADSVIAFGMKMVDKAVEANENYFAALLNPDNE